MSRWVEAARVEEFDGTDRKLVDLGGGRKIGLFRVDGDFLAVGAWCTHQRAVMVEGPLDGWELMCPLHGARFDLRTGEALCLPAVEPVATYPTRVSDGIVFVNIEE